MNYIDNEKQIVAEALNRGATVGFLSTWLWCKRRGGTPTSPPSKEEMRHGKDEIRQMIQPELDAYRNKVTAEFQSLPKIGFRDLKHYFTMRPLYYLIGFDHPKEEVLAKILPSYQFLGQTIPVHALFKVGLDRVQQILRNVPGLYERMCGLVSTRKGDGCFCPRFVADSTKLSAHAFGLAIDIENLENPMIKGAIIPLLNQAIKTQSGIDYDFGSRFLDRLQNSRLLDNRQQLLLKYGSAKKASEALQEWLKENLAMYDTCLQQIQQGKGAGKGTAAFVIAETAQSDLDKDEDLQLLKLLIKANGGRNELDGWAQTGILNLPIELVAAFYVAFSGDPNFLWGGADYHDSKDFMHFEQQPLPGGQPSRPGCLTANRSGKPRALADLFPPWIGAFLIFENPEIDELLEGL